MTRALKIRQKQVTALCKGAKAAGFIPVVEIDGAVVKLIPADHAILSESKPAEVDDERIIPL
ncbi:MAG: hypothetical protein ACTHKQ_17875 [Mesorhizobium sp.]